MKSFEQAAEKAEAWVRELMTELKTDDRDRACRALRAGLHALRDRLDSIQAAKLSAQLPLVIRGLFFEGWHPSGKPIRARHKAEFLAMIDAQFERAGVEDPELVARAVFRLLDRHVSPGEVTDLKHILPRHIAALWSSPPSVPAASADGYDPAGMA